ncbi:MAG: hypothetical protein QXR17_08375 [Candidatus Bathyarchaeia archaeon]
MARWWSIGLGGRAQSGGSGKTALMIVGQINGSEVPVKLKLQAVGILVGRFVEDANFRAAAVNALRVAMGKRNATVSLEDQKESVLT